MLEAAPPDASAQARHRLAWLDQVAYELFRATGRTQLMQCIWLYEREVDLDALALTRERIAALPINRLIERSPLPWGRPRWVRPSDAPVSLGQSPHILPRSGLLKWANQQARTLIDPVRGPAWQMVLQRFDDGSTAVSIVVSHLVIDGLGGLRGLEAAANGTLAPSPYLTRGSRAWLEAWASDALQIMADAPRTVVSLARVARANWRSFPAPAPTPMQTQSIDHSRDDKAEVLELPSVAVRVDSRVWDDRARRLGGRANALFPGLLASLAARLGRCRSSDGAITLLMPVDTRRGMDDARALAFEFRKMSVHPAGLANDLTPLNQRLIALLRGANDQSDVLAPFLPAIAWMPRTIATILANRVFDYTEDAPVSCSNLGTLPDGLARIDGTACNRILTRAVDVNVTRRDLERSRGHLVAVASRYGETVSLCIEGCQLNPQPTTTAELRQKVEQTLAEFGLDAVLEC